MIKVFNFKRFRVYIIISMAAILLFAAIGIFRPDVLSAWNENRDIPIYSVGTDQKKTSVTFDCAWVAVP